MVLTVILRYFLQKAGEMYNFVAEIVVQPPLAFNVVFLGVLETEAEKKSSHWQ